MKLPVLTADDKIAEIRRLYFATTRQSIADDIAKAVQLLKSMATEDERERAAVFMDGLAQMRSDWARADRRRRAAGGTPRGTGEPTGTTGRARPAKKDSGGRRGR
jgi:hypothetical protein